jgi:predicted transcriptional regulator
MRTAVRDTSLAAFRAMGPRLGTQQRTVVEYLEEHRRAFTRNELALATGLALSAICGRVNELVKAGALVECPRRRCHVTGKSAHPVRLAPEQMSFL